MEINEARKLARSLISPPTSEQSELLTQPSSSTLPTIRLLNDSQTKPARDLDSDFKSTYEEHSAFMKDVHVRFERIYYASVNGRLPVVFGGHARMVKTG